MFNEDTIMSNMFAFFVGSFDTSSSTLTYCLYELALNRQIQEKLRKEIINASKKQDCVLSYASLNDLKYMDMVICGKLSNSKLGN